MMKKRIKQIPTEQGKSKVRTLGAEILLTICATENRPKCTLLALLDTGTSGSLINSRKIEEGNCEKNKKKHCGIPKEECSKPLLQQL